MGRGTNRKAPPELLKRLQQATDWDIKKCEELLAKVPSDEQEAFVRQMELDYSVARKQDWLSKRRR
jgi:hypothetical protein